MSEQERPTKRLKYVSESIIFPSLPCSHWPRYDLHSTFDVVVGSETFPLHTSVFTERSEFFRAARKPEWLAGDAKMPVDLKDENAEVFSTYINCAYFGRKILKHYADEHASCLESGRYAKVVSGFRALVDLYLLADKLQDLPNANMAIDELMCFSDHVRKTREASCSMSTNTLHGTVRCED